MKWVVDYHARQNWARLSEQQLAFHYALLDYSAASEQFDHHVEKYQFIYNHLQSQLMPWVAAGPTDAGQIVEQLVAQYEEEFGDPNDPAYIAEMDKLIAHWEGKDAK